MQISLIKKKGYGVARFYPNCRGAALILEFLDQLYFEDGHVDRMIAEGWDVDIELYPTDLGGDDACLSQN